MRKDVREFIRRLEQPASPSSQRRATTTSSATEKPLRKQNGMPFSLPEGRQYWCQLSAGRGLGGSAVWSSSFLYLALRALVGGLVRSRRGLHVKRHRVVGIAARARDS